MTPNPYAAGQETLPQRPRPLVRFLRLWLPALISVLALLAVPVAFFAGAVVAESGQYNRRAEHQIQRIKAFLAEHPDKFAGLTVEKASNGWAYPMGAVETQEDFDLLADRLHEMFGDELAEQMLYAVDIECG